MLHLLKVTQISVYSLLVFYRLGDLTFPLQGGTLAPCVELDNYSGHSDCWKCGCEVRQPLQEFKQFCCIVCLQYNLQCVVWTLWTLHSSEGEKAMVLLEQDFWGKNWGDHMAYGTQWEQCLTKVGHSLWEVVCCGLISQGRKSLVNWWLGEMSLSTIETSSILKYILLFFQIKHFL